MNGQIDEYFKAHLPFERTFPSTYQEFLTKDDLAKGYREWVNKFEIVSIPRLPEASVSVSS